MDVDAADDGDDGDDDDDEDEDEDEDENEDDDPLLAACLFLAKARATSASRASFRENWWFHKIHRKLIGCSTVNRM